MHWLGISAHMVQASGLRTRPSAHAVDVNEPYACISHASWPPVLLALRRHPVPQIVLCMRHSHRHHAGTPSWRLQLLRQSWRFQHMLRTKVSQAKLPGAAHFAHQT